MSKPVMSTVDKALSLLRHFSLQRPEMGLSELARLAGYDKTTTLRCMTALERNGFVEQDQQSKHYRLGLAPINLARIRERSFPLLAILQPHVDALRDSTQETAHATVLSAGRLLTALVNEPDRATRVFMDPSVDLPLHATASGMIIAAHMPQAERAAFVASSRFERFTENTPVTPEMLEPLFAKFRAQGFARAEQSYEDDVIGTAVAFFDANGRPVGAIAVAAVASRFDSPLARKIEQELTATGRKLTRELGGIAPAPLSSVSEHAT
ncbi:IclR family transcriptional regulator [uncultured Sulfitobacter sp.]|uniref:IclR family transcriptional regulator n=1 Tax=uncultured Sulfitobacter sp. TaxID=191468 RepID=UPI0026172CA6|nr:IclR family transcriptional regulator [uncultured Sulfitobacter sp.]